MQSKIFILILLALLASCAGDRASSVALDAAESLMSERPDSSLALLREIDGSRIGSDDARARHALLLSQALDKNYIDETNDSLINIAVSHYASGSNPYYQFLSLYYQGRVYYNAGNFTKSILSYTQAEQLIDKFDNPHAVGLMYSQLGLIFREFYDFKKGLDAYEHALHYFKKAQSTPHQYYAIKDIGHCSYKLQEYDNAEKYILEAMNSSYNSQDYDISRECFELLTLVYESMADIAKLESLYNSKFRDICVENRQYYESIAYMESLNKRPDNAINSLQRAWELTADLADTVDLYITSHSIYKNLGEYRTALVYFEQAMHIQDSIVKVTMQLPLTTAQRDYYHDNAELNANKLKKSHNFIIIIIAISLIIIAGILIAIYIKNKKRNIEIFGYIGAIQDMKTVLIDKNSEILSMANEISSKNLAIDNFSNQVAVLFGKQFELFDKLSSIYYESNNSSRNKDKIYQQVKSEIENFKSDSYPQLEQIVNTYKENVMQLLREQVALREDDYRLLCYSIAGFSTKSISIFTGNTTTNITTRKWRLKSAIAKEKSTACDIILKYLG